MGDIVTEAIVDLQKKLAGVSVIKNKLVYIYEQDMLLDKKRELSTPCAGIVYLGLVGLQDKARNENLARLECEIILIGGDKCVSKTLADLKPTTTTILDDIRTTVRTTVGATEKKWTFVSETPFDFARKGASELGYAQRWYTIVPFTA